MSQRHEFVLLAGEAGSNFRQLCRRFGISPKTGYKWRQRFRSDGVAGLADRSRRPKTSPRLTAAAASAEVIAVRQAHPTWGGRKLHRRLRDLHCEMVPAASTCTAILRRAHLLVPGAGLAHTAVQRFERAQPNELWQMDFKGHIPTQAGPRCHPLTVLDDHSRFNVVLAACGDETGATVRTALTAAFGRYGLPEALLCDNGPPWGRSDAPGGPAHTALTVWLLRLGVRVLHGRPYHPQTQGKEERFHRTLRRSVSRFPGRLQLRASARFPRRGHPGFPLPTQSAQPAGGAARDRLSLHRYRARRALRRYRHLRRPDLAYRRRLCRLVHRPAPERAGRRTLERLLLPPLPRLP